MRWMEELDRIKEAASLLGSMGARRLKEIKPKDYFKTMAQISKEKNLERDPNYYSNIAKMGAKKRWQGKTTKQT